MSPFDRPPFTVSRPGEGFEIHYAHRSRDGFRADPYARGKPVRSVPLDGVRSVDYVEAVARALETARKYYEHQLPSAAGKLPLIHVYLGSLGTGFDGLTLAGASGPEIWLRNRYEESAGPLVASRIEAACAHELFHAHQLVLHPGLVRRRSPVVMVG